MIVKVLRFQTIARFRRYVRYCISPKEHGGAEPERLLHCEGDSVVLPVSPSPADPSASVVSAKLISEQFWDWIRATRPGKPSPKYPIVAPIVTFHPDDHHKLTPALEAEIIRELIARVMPGRRQVFLPIHGDTDHGHGHPSVGAVDAEGRIWNPRFDYRLWEQGCEDLEIEYGLTRVRQRKACAKTDRAREVMRSSPKSSELQAAIRTRTAPPRLRLQEQLAGILRDSPGFPVFAERLAALQIRAVPNVAGTGRVSGLTFIDAAGEAYKGSSLGKTFAFAAVARITNYDQDQHSPIISRWLHQPGDRLSYSSNGGAASGAPGDQTGGIGAHRPAMEGLGPPRSPESSPLGRECPVGPRIELGRPTSPTAAGDMGTLAQTTGDIRQNPGEAVGGSQRSSQASRFEFLAKQWADLARRSISQVCETLAAVARVASRMIGPAHRQVKRPDAHSRMKARPYDSAAATSPHFQL